ncbi:transposable element Tcb1 transposase [Trichonephila clavipes]|nr:transposable element Tcb1 transposase [Trichonephila clavipes]
MDPQPRNLAQLATALESAWLNIPENTFRDLSDSLPARLAAVRSAKGIPGATLQQDNPIPHVARMFRSSLQPNTGNLFHVLLMRNEINQNAENGVLSNFDINNGPVAIENDNSIPVQTASSPQTGRIQIPVLELNDVQNQIHVRRSVRLKSMQMSVHLVNNVPNSYFEAKNSANWQN